MWQIGRMIGMGLLAALSIEDIRTRRISNPLLLMAGILGIIYQIWTKENPLIMLLGGLGIGLIFGIISYLSRESLGYGDSLLIGILGIYVGAVELLEILAVAWSMATVVSMVLLVRYRFTGKSSLPFIPFLTIGYTVSTIMIYTKEYVGSV